MKKQIDFAVINQTIWPDNEVIGDALLALAEDISKTKNVGIITSSKHILKKKLKSCKRGKGIVIRSYQIKNASKNNLLSKTLSMSGYMLWVIHSLVILRPKKVYIATHPPVIIPFVVYIYSKIFRAKYYYHVQDIHPEAASIIIPIFKPLFFALRIIDSLVLRHASGVITLSKTMRKTILLRSNTKSRIYIVNNPAYIPKSLETIIKSKDFIFSGNAGRFQRIPLLIEAIDKYISEGGSQKFTFLANGIHTESIIELDAKYNSVSYLGYIDQEAASIEIAKHKWGILPINDEVTRYAFPSKSSTYIALNCNILAICGEYTSVSKWVKINRVGQVIPPDANEICNAFKRIEDKHGNKVVNHTISTDYSIKKFVENMTAIMEI